jgi:1-acyl-sn-glycerol-3-phosphate acyltransferase
MIRRGARGPRGAPVFFLLGICYLLVLYQFERRGPSRWLAIPGADMVMSPSMPRRGNWLTRLIGRLAYKLTGWSIEGRLPNVPKLVMAGAPHTCHGDVVVALGFFTLAGLKCRWMVKEEVFMFPISGIIRWLGALPVNRHDPGELVQELSDEINRSEKFVLVITPEGARRKVGRWKTGFYRIALATGAPITLAYADVARRVVSFGPTYQPNGEMEMQIEEMRAYFEGITARNPAWA